MMPRVDPSRLRVVGLGVTAALGFVQGGVTRAQLGPRESAAGPTSAPVLTGKI
jgi:hypothetical protein